MDRSTFGLTGSKVSEDFIELAICLVSAPASSASIKRVFSTFTHVHNKVRNRLSVEKAQKLVYAKRIGFFAETQQTTLIDNRINYIILIFIKFNLINTNLLMN